MWKLFQLAVICAVLVPVIKWRGTYGPSAPGSVEMFFWVVLAIGAAISATKLGLRVADWRKARLNRRLNREIEKPVPRTESKSVG
jgi:hypothetical protein